jgi:HSF-type DNA-binding
MKVLSCKEYEQIVCWTPSGKAFTIEKPKAFTSEILPEHFKTAKYSSFTRKLHRWGFMRHYRGPEAGSFFHKDFMKGRIDLVEKMTCYTKGEGNGVPGPDGTYSKNSSGDNKGSTKEGLPVQKERSDEAFYRSLAASMSSSVQSRPVVQVPVPRRASLPIPSSSNPDSLLAREQLRQHRLDSCSADLQSQLHAASTSQQMSIKSDNPAVAPSSSSNLIHAAIEIEVARRLNERLTQVAMTKRALELLQPRPTPPPVLMPNSLSQLLGSSSGQGLLGWNRSDLHSQALQLQQQLRNRDALLSSVQGMSDMDSLAVALPLAALQRELDISNNNNSYKAPAINYSGASAELFNNMSTLPPTNIQGAKTA